MRKSMVLIAGIAAQCLAAGAGHATQVVVKLTEEQVRTTCGTLIVQSGDRVGCKKHCGDGKTCGFHCDKNGKDCKGLVVERGTPPSQLPVWFVRLPLLGGVLK